LVGIGLFTFVIFQFFIPKWCRSKSATIDLAYTYWTAKTAIIHLAYYWTAKTALVIFTARERMMMMKERVRVVAGSRRRETKGSSTTAPLVGVLVGLRFTQASPKALTLLSSFSPFPKHPCPLVPCSPYFSPFSSSHYHRQFQFSLWERMGMDGFSLGGDGVT